MILEGIVTTINPDGTTNVSPMGPLVESETFAAFVLRPYRTSTTYANLRRTRYGVLHITDDVELIAHAALGTLSQEPVTYEVPSGRGRILKSACRWLAFEVESLDEQDDRPTIQCQITEQGRLRDFFGFCRAKHAVLEAAILATRLEHLPYERIQSEMRSLRLIVEKTAGEAERRAFKHLENHIAQHGGVLGPSE